MYELISLGQDTFYVDCPSIMGIYHRPGGGVVAIDSGNEPAAGQALYNIINDRGWHLDMVINTHSHADHIGGNAFLQEKTGCNCYSVGIEKTFIENTFLEPELIFGADTFDAIETKVYMAHPSRSEELTADVLPQGFEICPLPGHSFNQIGVKTPDNVWFIGDSVVSEDILNKYHLTYLVNIKRYLSSLETLKSLKGRWFVPTHGAPAQDIAPLADKNRDEIYAVANLIHEICMQPKTLDELQKELFDHYGRTISVPQYVLTGSIIRTYLSYLRKCGRIEPIICNNNVKWKGI